MAGRGKGHSRKVWVPPKKKAVPAPAQQKIVSGGRRVAEVIPVPKKPRPVPQSQLPQGLWDSIESDPRAWSRDPRDPPESYFDGRSATGLIRPEKWECSYGCPGVQVLLGTNVPHHAWNCPYWKNEGKDKTPF